MRIIETTASIPPNFAQC